MQSFAEHQIYTNEGAWSLTMKEFDPAAGVPYSPFRDGIPTGIDVISFDGYSAGTVEVDQHRALYQTHLYPKLAPHQRAAVVPGLFGCSLPKKGKCEANASATGPHCMCALNGDDLSDEAQSAKLVAKLEGYMSWAREDPNIAGIIPWHYSNRMEMTALTPSYGLGAAAFPALVQRMLEYGWRNVSQLIQNCTPFDSSHVKTDDDDKIAASPRDGNSTRQLVLFLDDTQLSEVKGDIAVQMNKPVKHERPVLTPTEPWESWAILFYNTVLFVAEDDVRLYYSCAAQGPCPAGENCDDLVTGYWHTCLAISQDGGLTFVKPSLGVAVFNGSKQNNIVCEMMSLSRSHHLPSR